MDCQGWRVSATSDLSAAGRYPVYCARGVKYRHVFDAKYRSLFLPLADS